jgi:hypothetical protein
MYHLPLDHHNHLALGPDHYDHPETYRTRDRPCNRELAERSSSGTRVRLLWRQGTRHLWVEVREPDERMLAIPVEPERALDAFHHPYAYAGSHGLPLRAESLASHERRPQAADRDYHEQ